MTVVVVWGLAGKLTIIKHKMNFLRISDVNSETRFNEFFSLFLSFSLTEYGHLLANPSDSLSKDTPRAASKDSLNYFFFHFPFHWKVRSKRGESARQRVEKSLFLSLKYEIKQIVQTSFHPTHFKGLRCVSDPVTAAWEIDRSHQTERESFPTMKCCVPQYFIIQQRTLSYCSGQMTNNRKPLEPL